MQNIRNLKPVASDDNHIAFRGGYAICTLGGVTLATPSDMQLGLAPEAQRLIRSVEAHTGTVTTAEMGGTLSVKMGRRTLKVPARPVADVPYHPPTGTRFDFADGPAIKRLLKVCKGTSADSLASTVHVHEGVMWWSDRKVVVAHLIALPNFAMFVEDLNRIVNYPSDIVGFSAGERCMCFYYADGGYAVGLCVAPVELTVKHNLFKILSGAGDISLPVWPITEDIKGLLGNAIKGFQSVKIDMTANGIVLADESAILEEEVALGVVKPFTIVTAAVSCALHLDCLEVVEAERAVYFRTGTTCVAALKWTGVK